MYSNTPLRSAASNNSSAIALSLLVATAYLILFTSRYCISWYTPFFTGIPYCLIFCHTMDLKSFLNFSTGKSLPNSSFRLFLNASTGIPLTLSKNSSVIICPYLVIASLMALSYSLSESIRMPSISNNTASIISIS